MKQETMEISPEAQQPMRELLRQHKQESEEKP